MCVAEDMRLIFAGKQLENDKLLSTYITSDGCTIHQVLRLRGGHPDMGGMGGMGDKGGKNRSRERLFFL